MSSSSFGLSAGGVAGLSGVLPVEKDEHEEEEDLLRLSFRPAPLGLQSRRDLCPDPRSEWEESSRAEPLGLRSREWDLRFSDLPLYFRSFPSSHLNDLVNLMNSQF